jgi:hypothetical protein
MARQKKEVSESPEAINSEIEVFTETDTKVLEDKLLVVKDDRAEFVHPFYKRIKLRNQETGLLNGKDHPLDENGFVNWRAMIDKKFFVLNQWNYARKFGIDIAVLTEEEKQEHLNTAKDEDLLVLLGGFKSVARLRGYSSINSELVSSDAEKSVVKVTITWIPNFETDFNTVRVSAIKSASLMNTHKDFFRYSEAIAENRAFITCVRNTLNIPVIGNDELKEDESLDIKYSAPKPNKFLKEFCEKNRISFGEVATLAQENKYNWSEKWEDFNKIDASTAGSLLHDLTRTIRDSED